MGAVYSPVTENSQMVMTHHRIVLTLSGLILLVTWHWHAVMDVLWCPHVVVGSGDVVLMAGGCWLGIVIDGGCG